MKSEELSRNINSEQMKAALNNMSEWLAHPAELGKAPSKIECAGTFEEDNMTYYIFRYKKGMFGKWLIGVCGGYEGDELENCGHTFSEMEEYNEADAVSQAKALVETVRGYWKNRAEEADQKKENPGTFVHCILLPEVNWDKQALLSELKEKWSIEDEFDESEIEESENKADDDTIVIKWHGAMIAISLMRGPVPYEEIEDYAARNYLWKEGTKEIRKHKVHILAAVIGGDGDMEPEEAGELIVKIDYSCFKLFGGIGVYTGDVVYEREHYMKLAKAFLDDDMFPIYNLVWFGLYRGDAIGKSGVCGYTGGMRNFGYDEIEVIGSNASPKELQEFLADIAGYVISEKVVLNDGETIGFSEEQKLPITKSAGVAVQGSTLKIEFQG